MIKFKSSISPRERKKKFLLPKNLNIQKYSGFSSFNYPEFSSPHFTNRKAKSPQSTRIKQVYQVYVSKNNLSPIKFRNLTPKLPKISTTRPNKYNRLTSDQFREILNRYRNTSQVVESDDLKITDN